MGAARLTVNSMCDREPAMGVGLAAAGSSASPSPPVKASSPAHNYMESMDISSSTMVTSPGFSATTPAASIAASASAPPEQLAVRACEKCTRSKRKCDKRLPACGRCLRSVSAFRLPINLK